MNSSPWKNNWTYKPVLLISLINFLKSSGFNKPKGLVNEPNPEGHSGHFKLQWLVGSIEYEIGIPHTTGFLISLATVKDDNTFTALIVLLTVKYFNRFISNSIFILYYYHNKDNKYKIAILNFLIWNSS